jgi:hypothetical protein
MHNEVCEKIPMHLTASVFLFYPNLFTLCDL